MTASSSTAPRRPSGTRGSATWSRPGGFRACASRCPSRFCRASSATA
nr:MAG TPA: hypothetical protein [Caudoviricetes sp.]